MMEDYFYPENAVLLCNKGVYEDFEEQFKKLCKSLEEFMIDDDKILDVLGEAQRLKEIYKEGIK